MIHPAKLGQFIGAVLVVLTFMERECSCWDRGYEIAFYCMKVEAVQREMCGKFGLNPLDPFRPDSVQSGSTAKSINDLFFFTTSLPSPVTFVEEDLFRFRARATFRARPRVQIG